MQPNTSEFNKYFKRTSTKALTEIKATPVVLVCIYNHNNTLITHDILYDLFSRYGKILRILIFEKVKVWKAFVEYTTLESAFEAKRNLNDYLLFNDGTRLNVYFSNLERIQFQNNNSGGIDYTLQEEAEPLDPNQNFQNISNLLPRQNIPVRTDSGSPNPMYPQPIKKQDVVSSPSFDDKGDEILKIINERQIEKDHTTTTDDDEKTDPDDSEKNTFQPFLLNVFQPQPTQPILAENQGFPKPRTSSRPYEESDGFQRPVIVRHAGHKHTAPPGLAIHQNLSAPPVNFYPSPDNRRLPIPTHGSYSQIPSTFSSNKNEGQLFRPPSGQELPMPRNMPHPTSQFNPQQNMRMNNFSPYQFNMGDQGQPNRLTKPNLPIPTNGEGQILGEVNEVNEGSPDNFSYQNLFDLIEKDISVELTNKMKGLDINAGPPGFNGPQDVHGTFGYGTNPQGFNYADNGDDKKSQVIYVKGLDDPNITINMVYNLFGNFGNVLKLIFIRSKCAALLEYENADYANIARDYLNNIILLGKPLRIFYSNYSIINLRYKKTNKEFDEEMLVPNPKTYRFKKNKNISINPPSATLHISNLAQEVCTEEAIKSFFNPYGTVLALQFIVKDGKWMCLMKLGSIEESINIMAILNDAPFGGRRVQLSFTRSKI